MANQFQILVLLFAYFRMHTLSVFLSFSPNILFYECAPMHQTHYSQIKKSKVWRGALTAQWLTYDIFVLLLFFFIFVR